MATDWFRCDICEATFPHYYEYVLCKCGKYWCSEDCADADGYDEETNSCKYCRGEDFTDSQLLEFCLELLESSRFEAVESYKEYLNENK